MTNAEVAEAWREGKKAHSLHMSTDGSVLYSYSKPIGITADSGEKVVLDYTDRGLGFVSMTTSHHVSVACREADDMVYALDNLVQDNFAVVEVRYGGKVYRVIK
jgi:hypothetical protein